MPIMMLPVSEPESVSEPVSMAAMSIGFKKTPPRATTTGLPSSPTPA